MPRATLLLLVLSLLLGRLALAADPVFDLAAIAAPPLELTVTSRVEAEGIVTEELRFFAGMAGETRMEIFAFFCYPVGAKALPAFVWNQGGLGRASTWFPLLGARRGYAAMCIDFPMPGYRSTGNLPIVSGIKVMDDPRQMPIYHGAVALLRAVQALQSRAEVDPEKIGMCGSSWGGFYTTLMAGVDPRLKAASSMFGCGHLAAGSPWLLPGSITPEQVAQWQRTLDPAPRLGQRAIPLSITTGTNDHFYWLNNVVATLAGAKGPTQLALLPNWDHGLTNALDDQVFGWLDVHLKGAPAFNTVTPVVLRRADTALVAEWSWAGPRPVTAAELMISYGPPGNWKNRYWLTVPATVTGQTCQATLPAASSVALVVGTVIDAQEYRYSTGLTPVDPPALGVTFPKALPDYDGASLWGDFEAAACDYLSRLALLKPEVSKDAQGGQTSVSLPAGKVAHLRPIYYTAGVPHRLAFWMKAPGAAEPVAVSMTLGGKTGVTQDLTVPATWTEVRLDYTPAAELSQNLGLQLKVPKDVTILVDTLSFRPLPATP